MRCQEHLIFLTTASCYHARRLLGVVSSSPGSQPPQTDPALHSQLMLIRPQDLWSVIRSNCSIRQIVLFLEMKYFGTVTFRRP